MNCEKVFNFLVDELEKYLKENKLESMVLGISGGIDSTVVAAICHEVSRRTGIPLIGRSLPTKFNKEGETTAADLVGKAFCNNYKVCNINQMYFTYTADIILNESGDVYYDVDHNNNIINIQDDFLSPVAKGNIQARLRMIYLYNLASINKGIVMDTDNLTENNLGYFTIHGDVGDYNPIHCLWKTEVFELAEWLFNIYKNNDHSYLTKAEAVWASLQLKPTAGLGITDSDLDEIGANSYEEIDSILKVFVEDKDENSMRISILREKYGEDIVNNVIKRHKASEFKRNRLPVYPIIGDKDQ